MEIVRVATEIENRIKVLSSMRESLRELSINKANAIARYEKELAKTIIKLRHGRAIEVDGEVVKDPPATLIEKIARGACDKELLDKDMAEAAYKNAISSLSTIQSELNGYQSIYRYLEETER